MAFFEDEYQPAFTYQGRPVYWTHLILAILAFFFIFGGILAGTGQDWIFEFTGMDQRAFPQVWRLFTYPLLDPYFYASGGFNSIWLIIIAVILYSTGMDVERHVGAKTYLQLYFFSIIIPSLIVGIISQFIPMQLNGVFPLAFAIIVAYATIFPTGDMWGSGISMAYSVWIMILINTVILFAVHDFGQLIGFWTACIVGYFCMRFAGSGKGMDFIVDWIERREEAKYQKQAQLKIVKKQEVEASLDSVLEKISQRGMASLTSSERAVLQKASSELQKRDRR